MGTWLRDLNGYRRSYRQDITFRELAREFPHMRRPRAGALVPDPWDDYYRRDLDDRTWKRHRTIRYRVKYPGRPPETRPNVVYDSPWFEKRFWYFGLKRPGRLIQFRVRFAYRRHKDASANGRGARTISITSSPDGRQRRGIPRQEWPVDF